jgi:hypothetical protein
MEFTASPVSFGSVDRAKIGPMRETRNYGMRRERSSHVTKQPHSWQLESRISFSMISSPCKMLTSRARNSSEVRCPGALASIGSDCPPLVWLFSVTPSRQVPQPRHASLSRLQHRVVSPSERGRLHSRACFFPFAPGCRSVRRCR